MKQVKKGGWQSAPPPSIVPLEPNSLRVSAPCSWWQRYPVVFGLFYVVISLVWLLGGDWLITTIWLDKPSLLVLLLKDALLIAGGGLFAWLLYTHVRTTRRVRKVPDMRLVEFIEIISDAAFIKDMAGRYWVLNAACAQWMEHPLEKCRGRSDSELLPSEIAHKLMQDDRNVIAKGLPLSSEETFMIGGESRIFLSTKWPYRDSERRIIGVIGIAHDITVQKQVEEQLRRTQEELESRVQERTAELLAINHTLEHQITARILAEAALRDSEERFRQMAEHIREVFWVYGILEERLLYISPAYEDVWGRSLEEFRDRPLVWIESVHPDDRTRVWQEAHVKKPRTGYFDQEYRIVRPDGSIRWIWDRGFPVRDENGHIYRIAGLAEDITARRLADDQLRRQQVDLAKMSRLSLAVELASSLAHELNQPLAAIVAYTQACLTLLRQDHTDPRELTSALEEVSNQGLRAGEIIRHLRELIQKHPVAQNKLDLNTLIHTVIHYAQLELRQSNATLTLELLEPLPTVLADDIQVQLVVLYLMRNALEAMQEMSESESRELNIRTIMHDSETVQVTICDTGRGLSPEAAERLFQPFFTTKSGGMGLSLSVSRSIIESQCGQLWATSNTDRGISFHFTLPIYRPPNIDILSQ